MKTQICPTCGNGKVPYGFKITAPVVTATKAPRRLVGERTEHGVLVPSYQATGSGVISGLIGTVGSSLFWPALECVKVGALVGLTTGGLVWALALWDDRARVWYELERRFGVDLDGDGFVGKPATPTQSKGNNQYLPVHSAPKRDDHKELKGFVRGCQAVGTAQNYWETTRKMKREKFIELRELLIGLGWAGWVSPNTKVQGWKLLFTAEEIIIGLFRGTTRDGTYTAPPLGL